MYLVDDGTHLDRNLSPKFPVHDVYGQAWYNDMMRSHVRLSGRAIVSS